ncbi:MAG: hypothetical protein WC159_01895 [Sphaerochaetaceae bacterium]|jgi:hypothetical protein
MRENETLGNRKQATGRLLSLQVKDEYTLMIKEERKCVAPIVIQTKSKYWNPEQTAQVTP